MPPKTKITKEMIVTAAFDIVREQGAEHLNVRSVSDRLNCSTQPVMYHFKRVGDLRSVVYERAEQFQMEYLFRRTGNAGSDILGVNYIRFAATEKNLFRFLFQTNEFEGRTLTEVIGEEKRQPIVKNIKARTGLDEAGARMLFRHAFLFIHGYAGIFANNTMPYNEEEVTSDLIRNQKSLQMALAEKRFTT